MNNTLSLNPPFVYKHLLFWNWRPAIKIFLVSAVLSILILSAFYIFQVISENEERYLISEYELRLNEFSKANQKLESDLAEANSLDNVIALMEKFNFEKVEKINYIKVLSNQMVAK